MDRIKELISEMTLEEKASLCSGADNWHTKEIKRLNIPSVMMVDGPHGLRKQEGETDHLGLNESVKAVCFPAACATASSFDVDLMERMGETLGAECQAKNVSILLGPAVNIKRSPLCGRNFEYLSEDPYLAGRMASAYIRGVQSQGVGTSIKHFALNNQETLRMTISSEVSERALREIYLPAFEEAVKESAPRTVMCSYNKINGEYASENRYLLTDILRKEWGYKGCVVSDWGAVNNRVKGLQAGLDLEMPGPARHMGDHLLPALMDTDSDARRLDDAAPARYQQAAFALKRTECRGLEFAKTILALGLKYLGHRLAASTHNQTIGIDESTLEHSAHVARKRRLARAQKADKEDMVAAVFDVLRHGETYSSQGRSRRARRSKIRKICVYHRSCVACGFTRMVSTPAKLPLHTSV